MAYLMSERIQWRDFAGQYLLGNIIATIAAIITATTVQQLTGSPILTALAANLADNVVWYVYLFIYNLRRGDTALSGIRHIIQDFGLAEVLDTFLIRPSLYYVMPKITGAQATGVLTGTVIADIIYTLIALNRQRHRTKSELSQL